MKFIETLCGRLINIDTILRVTTIEGNHYIFIAPDVYYQISNYAYEELLKLCIRNQ